MSKEGPQLLALMGPTAVGKSAVAELLAETLDCRIVSADAFQVYRGFDIGTNKPANRERYELIDICDPTEHFSVGQFVKLSSEVIRRETDRGKDVIVCGGTGLYVRALFEGYTELHDPPDPGLRTRLQTEYRDLGAVSFASRYGFDPTAIASHTLNNPRHFVRVVERSMVRSAGAEPIFEGVQRAKVGLVLDREELNVRIDLRVENMMQNGWLQEVLNLETQGVTENSPAMRAIGYQELLNCGSGIVTMTEAMDSIRLQTRQYAKRQMTWLRKEPGIQVLDAKKEPEVLASEILALINSDEGGRHGQSD